MYSLALRINGWKLVIASLTGAAIGCVLLFLWSQHEWGAQFLPSTWPQLSTATTNAPAAVVPLTDRAKARQRLEATGSSFDGPSFVQAVTRQLRPLIDLLRQAGIDLNAMGDGGRTALLAAALNRDWPLFNDFLKAGAKPNLADKTGLTALMAAATSGEVAPLQALLAHGAEVNAADANGHTAAHYAVVAKAAPALNFLLEHGAATTGTCCGSHTLLSHAYETSDWNIILPVLSRAPDGLPWDSAGRGAILSAVQARDAEKTKLLMSKYAGDPTPDGHTQPLLAYAVVNNDLAGFRFLLDCGASPNSPIHSPVEKSFAQQIPSAGFRDYLESDTGINTLMLAAGMGRIDFIKALLERGAKRFEATAKYKMIPLYFAAQQDQASAVQMLLGDSPTPEQVRIEISLAAQRATVIRNGESVISTEISTGKPGFATPTGDFVITDKHLTHTSSLYKAQMPFFMRLNCRDFGMHQGVVPGHPASHGCIRLPGAMAQRLFKEIPIGTLVSIRQ